MEELIDTMINEVKKGKEELRKEELKKILLLQLKKWNATCWLRQSTFVIASHVQGL